MAEVSKGPENNVEDVASYAKIHPLKKAMRTKAFPLFVMLVIVIIVFIIISPMANLGMQIFFRPRTFWRILQDLAVPGFLTIGVGCLIVAGNIDLSAANVASMAGVIIATGVAWNGTPWWLAIILALVAAAVVGLVNGILVNELKQVPFIATMAVSTILMAVMQIISTNAAGMVIGIVNFTSRQVSTIGQFRIWGEVPAASVVMALFFLVYGLVLSRSKLGRTLYLMGGNRAATHLAGINPRKITYFLFINCSMLAALSGIVSAGRTGMGGSAMLMAMQFTGMTAAILGGISFGGGSGGMGGAFLGLLVINTFGMGMTSSGGNAYLTTIMQGALLLIALTFDYFNIRAQNKRVGA
jgi:ribose/xylose/arabinose/galactoside ABC-type transport system permease subunit